MLTIGPIGNVMGSIELELTFVAARIERDSHGRGRPVEVHRAPEHGRIADARARGSSFLRHRLPASAATSVRSTRVFNGWPSHVTTRSSGTSPGAIATRSIMPFSPTWTVEPSWIGGLLDPRASRSTTATGSRTNDPHDASRREAHRVQKAWNSIDHAHAPAHAVTFPRKRCGTDLDLNCLRPVERVARDTVDLPLQPPRPEHVEELDAPGRAWLDLQLPAAHVPGERQLVAPATQDRLNGAMELARGTRNRARSER